MQKVELNPTHILGNSLCCVYRCDGWTCLVATRGVEISTFPESQAVSCSTLRIFQYFLFVSALLENAVSHGYIDGN